MNIIRRSRITRPKGVGKESQENKQQTNTETVFYLFRKTERLPIPVTPQQDFTQTKRRRNRVISLCWSQRKLERHLRQALFWQKPLCRCSCFGLRRSRRMDPENGAICSNRENLKFRMI